MAQNYINELPERKILELSELFKALGDSSRIKLLLQVFADEMSVSDAANKLKLSYSTVSHHLNILRMYGLVCSRRQGKHIFYHANEEYVKALLAQCCNCVEKFSNGGVDAAQAENSMQSL